MKVSPQTTELINLIASENTNTLDCLEYKKLIQKENT